MSRENAEAADRLERERLAVVREYRNPPPSREYRDLLDVAHATCRAHDERQEKTA